MIFSYLTFISQMFLKSQYFVVNLVCYLIVYPTNNCQQKSQAEKVWDVQVWCRGVLPELKFLAPGLAPVPVN